MSKFEKIMESLDTIELDNNKQGNISLDLDLIDEHVHLDASVAVTDDSLVMKGVITGEHPISSGSLKDMINLLETEVDAVIAVQQRWDLLSMIVYVDDVYAIVSIEHGMHMDYDDIVEYEFCVILHTSLKEAITLYQNR